MGAALWPFPRVPLGSPDSPYPDTAAPGSGGARGEAAQDREAEAARRPASAAAKPSTRSGVNT